MSREMRSCRSRRACNTFVSASLGGSQQKSSTSGEDRHVGSGVVPQEGDPGTPQPQARTPRLLTSAVQGHVAVVAASTRLTGSDAHSERLLPRRLRPRLAGLRAGRKCGLHAFSLPGSGLAVPRVVLPRADRGDGGQKRRLTGPGKGQT